MTPQEMQIVDKAYEHLSSLNTAEVGFVRSLAENLDIRKRFTLSPKQIDWLHNIDQKLFHMGISAGPMQFTTITGRTIEFRAITIDDISIHDIAHSLSMVCRFGGHVRSFYSVALHSIRVAELCPPALRLQGLLHDATEAYLGDVVTPLKKLLPEYRRMESTVWRVIAERFGIAECLSDEVKDADTRALAEEASAITAIQGFPHSLTALSTMTPDQASTEFLHRFLAYGGKP